MRDSRALLPSSFVAGSAQRGFDIARLLAPADAIRTFFECAPVERPPIVHVALIEAAGRVLANDAVARENIPTHRRSTMDGYALRSGDGVTPRRIVMEVLMGHAPVRDIGPGEAARVPTGGAVPVGADSIVPQEDCDVTAAGDIVPHAVPVAGDCMAQPGEDITAGESVLHAGRRIGAPELGVLATLGITSVPVFRKPRVAIVSTGDELIDPDAPLVDGSVRDSNRYAIAAALAAIGAEPVHVPRSPDTFNAVRASFVDALATCDAIVSSGGSSVGEKDLVPRVVADLGSPGAIVHGLRVRPGKPTLLAAALGKPIIGLPGNPTSSLMILEAVVSPIIRALTGETSSLAPRISAIAAQPFAGRAEWTWYVPVRTYATGGVLYAEPLRMRSSQTSLLARAGGYVTMDASFPGCEAGGRLDVSLFSCGGAPIEERS